MKKKKWAIGFIGTISISIVELTVYLFRKTIKRVEVVKPKQISKTFAKTWAAYSPMIYKEIDWLKEQNQIEMYIQSKEGLRLRGIWLEAPKETKKVIITLHGYRSRGENEFAPIAHFYHNEGYHVLMVDHRAHGKSEGKYVGFGVLDYQDCKRWIKRIVEELGGEAQIYVHGISMGGATAVALCSEDLPPQVKGIIADCAFTSPRQVFKHVLRKEYHLPSFLILPLVKLLCKRRAGYDIEALNNIERVQHSKLPILFIHGDQDDFVPTWMSKVMYDACQSKRKLVLIKGARHIESYYKAPKTYQKVVKQFIEENQ